MVLASAFICRSSAFFFFLLPGLRPAAAMAMQHLFIRARKLPGDSMRAQMPALRMSTVAFIKVRAASRSSTQSVGKWMLAFRHVLSRSTRLSSIRACSPMRAAPSSLPALRKSSSSTVRIASGASHVE